MTKPAQLAEVNEALANGGFIRFTWKTGLRELVTAAGVRPLDGRTYFAILTRTDLCKTQSGGVEDSDLVIEWRAKV
jgi:hypothetical protein